MINAGVIGEVGLARLVAWRNEVLAKTADSIAVGSTQ
jgi:hypothetical protein